MENLERFAYDVGFYFMYIFVVQMVVPMPISIHNNQEIQLQQSKYGTLDRILVRYGLSF
jgi:hypothetical protein